MGTPSIGSDFTRGLEQFKGALLKHQLDLAKETHSREGGHSYFQFGKSQNLTDVILSDEFLEDLPGTADYQRVLNSYLESVSRRVLRPHPEFFYCESGVPVRIEMRWPIAEDPMRFAQLLRFTVTDLRSSGELAKCIAVLDPVPGRGDQTPFEVVRRVVNRARHDIDRGAVRFYLEREHPRTFQEINLIAPFPTDAPASQAELERFIGEKTYWLGFRAVERPSAVWIADDWDAEYLHVKIKDLRQAAHVLAARGFIELDTNFESARPAGELLTEGLKAVLPSLDPGGADASKPDFVFMKNDDLRRIVVRDYKELHSLDPQTFPKATLILAGSILEALLLDALVSSGKWSLEDGVQRNLRDMIGPAVTLGIVRSDRLSDAIRRYRTLVHAAREVREQLTFSVPDAKLARSAVDVLIQEIREWQSSRTPLSAG